MKQILPGILLTLLLAPLAVAQSTTQPAIIPQPEKYKAEDGTFTITSHTVLVVDDETRSIGQYFSDLLAPALDEKLQLTDAKDAPSNLTITLRLSPGLNRLGSEGYALVVTPTKIDIAAAGPAGVFYGCQTLRQMLPASIESRVKVDEPLTIQACSIEDRPRYPWRGMHLDVVRHFSSKETVERYIDTMAAYKMNVFHWHLTDDQGWRIEIKKYPLLTEKSAFRPYDPKTEIGVPVPASQPDGSPGLYGGFYTQDDIREVVAYAKARYVNVVPEIEMPGHSRAALAAYPEVSCRSGPFKVSAVWKGSADVFCPGKEQTFEFIDGVLDEVCDLFPGPYVHVGGDECPKDRWKKCPDCQQRMKDNGLKNEDELQSYFIKRVEAYLETKHHHLIGWNEILQGGLAPDATVTSWQGMEGGRIAAIAGHDVIMCPESNCYFDHTQDIGTNPKGPWDFLFQSPVSLPKVYSFEPTPADLTPQQAAHVLGGQGNIWSERVPTQDRLDYMAFPRAIALAECLWTPHRGDYPDFAARLVQNFSRLDRMGIKYYDDPMARATLIGAWQPSDKLPQKNKDVDFLLTPHLAEPGSYLVRFEFIRGQNPIDIDSVALLENGKERMRDTHAAHAGQDAQANQFLLKVDQLTTGATYTARASMRTEDGPDSQGQVFLLAAPATTNPATNPN